MSSNEWTAHSLSEWGIGIGFQPSLLSAGNGVMFYQFDERTATFAIYLPEHGEFLVEVGFNPVNQTSIDILEELRPDFYEVVLEEESRKWPRIGLNDFSEQLLSRISSWVSKNIEPPPSADNSVRPINGVMEAVAKKKTVFSAASKTNNGRKEEYANWLMEYLFRRNLVVTDGRPLYAYKTSDEELVEITDLLRSSALSHKHKLLLSDGRLAAMFVLFASEWWRKKYSGGPWTFQPIYQAIGLSPQCVDAMLNSPQVHQYPGLENGFRFWKRKIFTMGNKRAFIGSIAAEGGLPLNLLGDEDANLRRYFRRVLDRFLPLKAQGVSAGQVAEELRNELPGSFQRDEVYKVAGDIVEITLDLRSEYRLAAIEEPVKHLDNVYADWRERFPLSLDNEPAKALLSDLVVSVANTGDARLALSIVRFLSKRLDGAMRLNATVDFPRQLSIDSLSGVFGDIEWPSVFEIWLIKPKNVRLAVCSRINSDSFRVRSEGRTWSDEASLDESIVGLVAYGAGLGKHFPVAGGVLEEDLPWVFTETGKRLVYLGQGGMRLTSEKVSIVTKKSFEVVEDGSKLVPSGVITSLDRSVYNGGGVLQVFGEGAKYSIFTRDSKMLIPEYELKGKKLNRKANIKHLFVGMPRLVLRGPGVSPALVPLFNLKWRPAFGDNGWRDWSSDVVGVIDISVVDGQEVKYRSRIAVLPEATTFTFYPSNSVNTGQIKIVGLTDVRLATDLADIELTENRIEDGELLLTVCKHDEELSAFPLQVQWPSYPKSLVIMMPIPVVGARFGSSEDRWLSDGEYICVGDLLGVHAVGFNHLGKVAEEFFLDVRLQATDLDSAMQQAFSSRICLPKAEGAAEVPLIQLRSEFSRLLSFTKDLDCKIQLVLSSTTTNRRLFLARYSLVITREGGTLVLKPAQYGADLGYFTFDDFEFEVRSLTNPAGKGIFLEASLSEGVRTGQWELPDSLAPGHWLVVPNGKHQQSVRPTMIEYSALPSRGDGRIRDAMSLNDETSRRRAMIDCIRNMSQDYSHKDWSLVFDTLSTFNQVPATTLDLWDCFVQVPNSMAMLLVCANDETYQGVIELAEQLPFSWSLVSIQAWISSLALLKKSIKNSAPDSIATSLIELALTQKCSQILEADSVLLVATLISKEIVLEVQDQQLVELAIRSLDSLSEELRERHLAEEKWPQMRSDFLSRIRETAPSACSPLFTNQRDGMESVLHAPVAMALRTGSQEVTDRYFPKNTDLYELHRIREFDEVWFREVFSHTLALLYLTKEISFVDDTTENN